MEYRALGRSGLKVSSIGLGCVTFGREIDEATSFAVMDRAVERGINLFDTAEAYAQGSSEEVVGRWLKSRGNRDQIVLATKVSGRLTADRIMSSAEESLQRLQTDRVDLFQLHHWTRDEPLDEALEALDRLVREGKAVAVGCSNFDAEQMREGLRLEEENGWARMESVQPPYSLVAREIEDDLIPLCREQEIGILSYSPLGAGFLTGKYRQGGPVPEGTRFDVIPGHQNIYFHDEKFSVMEALRGLADREGISMIQLALAWVIRQTGITSVLIGGRKLDHVDQAFRAESLSLSPDLLEEMSRL